MQAGGISARKWEERVLVYYRKLLGVRTYHMYVRDMTYDTRTVFSTGQARAVRR